uniref:Uncharacterized protein n=1 Tax=Solanum tuberosum TaxID=4113 RepID=M1DBZ7_SOLTU
MIDGLSDGPSINRRTVDWVFLRTVDRMTVRAGRSSIGTETGLLGHRSTNTNYGPMYFSSVEFTYLTSTFSMFIYVQSAVHIPHAQCIRSTDAYSMLRLIMMQAQSSQVQPCDKLILVPHH